MIQEDLSKLNYLADLCVLEYEKTHPKKTFKSIPKRKRTVVCYGLYIQRSNGKRPLDLCLSSPAEPSNKRMKSDYDNEQKPPWLPSSSNVQSQQVEMREESRPIQVPKPIPAWVEELAHNHLHSAQPAVWICEKLLTMSDTCRNLMRFFIPNKSLEEGLFLALTDREKGMLVGGISVVGLDPNGGKWNLELKYWDSVSKNGQNILQKEWVDLVTENNLKAKKDTVEIWLAHYRDRDQPPQVDDKLCFFVGRKQI